MPVPDPARVDDLFAAALELPVTDRSRFLDSACRSDQEVRRRVERLLCAHADAGGFLQSHPAKAPTQPLTLLAPSSGHGARPRARAFHRPALPDGYEWREEIGRGGMGVVYLATQVALKRPVALKVLLAGGHASDEQRRRFLAEAEAVAAVNHPGIVQVFDYGTLNGQPWMALEYCAGGTLAGKLSGTPLPARDAALLVEKMARAVAVAHSRGIVHRDLKPSNILLFENDEPKIADFGLAKMLVDESGHTATGAILGTPSYMSPEQARGEAKHVGATTDVYALGAVLYECLTGRAPFRGASPAETVLQVLGQEPVAVRALNAQVAVDLETICLKCLQKDPARRYDSANALADDLGRFLSGRPITARPVSRFEQALRWCRRNPDMTTMLMALLVVTLTGTAVALMLAFWALREATAARNALAERDRAEERRKGIITGLVKPLATSSDTTEAARRDLVHSFLAAHPDIVDRDLYVSLPPGYVPSRYLRNLDIRVLQRDYITQALAAGMPVSLLGEDSSSRPRLWNTDQLRVEALTSQPEHLYVAYVSREGEVGLYCGWDASRGNEARQTGTDFTRWQSLAADDRNQHVVWTTPAGDAPIMMIARSHSRPVAIEIAEGRYVVLTDKDRPVRSVGWFDDIPHSRARQRQWLVVRDAAQLEAPGWPLRPSQSPRTQTGIRSGWGMWSPSDSRTSLPSRFLGLR